MRQETALLPDDVWDSLDPLAGATTEFLPLLTTDERLARSHGHHAEIIVPLR